MDKERDTGISRLQCQSKTENIAYSFRCVHTRRLKSTPLNAYYKPRIPSAFQKLFFYRKSKRVLR